MPGVGDNSLSWGDAYRLTDQLKGANCKLLIHSDTTDESVTFADSSGEGHTVAVGAATVQHDTDYAKFGATSIIVDDDSGYLEVSDDHGVTDYWEFASNAFTMDVWVRIPDLVEVRPLISQYDDATHYFYVGTSGANINMVMYDGGEKINQISATDRIVAATWHHLAWIRGWGGAANDYALCVDGYPVKTFTDGDAWPDMAGDLWIGMHNSTYWFDGSFDELRIVNGTAMWTKPFTPPRGRYR